VIADLDRTRAACRDKDPDLWFPLGASGPAALQAEYAKSVCRRCPVSDDCLEVALQTGTRFGIWGGFDMENERAEATRRVHR
jgi:WhiB family redox-sensing transcriptional regulator